MYRSASPIDNQNNRAPYAADLAQKVWRAVILDLADTNEEIRELLQNADYDITWHKSLYDAVNVCDLNLTAPITVAASLSTIAWRMVCAR